MMLLSPLFFVAAIAAAAGVVALHFLTRDRPPVADLPTARFVPEHAERVTSRTFRMSDVPLMLLRVALLLLAGLALAPPVLSPSRRAVARVVLVDASRSVASAAELRDSALSVLGEGDQLILLDSAVRRVNGAPRDSLRTLALSGARGSLSAGLIVALRTAGELRARADSVELVLVSPLAVEEVDAATRRLRTLWQGRARIVRVAATPVGDVAGGVTVSAPDDDPVLAGAALIGIARAAREGGDERVRIVRGALTGADSAWVRGVARVLVHWPADGVDAGWDPREVVDTVGAVIAGDAVVVAPFARHVLPGDGRVIARWVDGEPAARERSLGDGCIRDVAVSVTVRGDLVLRSGFADLLRALAQPCGGARNAAALDSAAIASLAGDGPLLAAASIAAPRSTTTPIVPWLLGAALLLALLEPVLRRGGVPGGHGNAGGNAGGGGAEGVGGGVGVGGGGGGGGDGSTA